MNNSRLSQLARRFAPMAILLLLLSAIMSLSMAEAYEPKEEDTSTRALSTAQDLQSGSPEVGVEWVVDYPPAGNSGADLPATAPDALGLYNQLGAAGWTKRFAWSNGNAWEQDWKGASKPGGGTENSWVDSVDMAYFAGHGSTSGFYFGVGGNTHDDNKLSYNDCRLEWGDSDGEWFGIAACNVLDDPNLYNWRRCMDGAHLILGFKTIMYDVPHGEKFGYYIRNGYNMTQAWFRAADVLQSQGIIARILAEEYFHFFDRPNNHIGGDVQNPGYWYWTHHVGSEPARSVDIDQLGGTVPTFLTSPLSLDEANAAWDDLGTAFNVNTSLQTTRGLGEEIRITGDSQLEMGNSDGVYAFTDLDQLWNGEVSTKTHSIPMRQITGEDARDIADTFLSNNGLMLDDAEFYEVVADTTSQATESERNVVQVVGENTEVWEVIYSRIVTATVANARGQLGEQQFSVMGPGAKLKVYVAPEAPANRSNAELAKAASAGGVVNGGQGGWREVDKTRQPAGNVTILSSEQIEKLFEELESTVAIGYVPLPYESRQITSQTIAYYELPIGTGQDQLIPVYNLNVDYTLEDSTMVTGTIYIPANEQYMAPLAQINTPTAIPDSVAVGQELTFEAVDATSQLSAVGYDASLDFALGTGDPDSYLYKWYVDSVSEENLLGNGQTLNYTVALDEIHPGSSLVTQTIILEVTDSSSPRPPSITKATYQVNVATPIYLPMLTR